MSQNDHEQFLQHLESFEKIILVMKTWYVDQTSSEPSKEIEDGFQDFMDGIGTIESLPFTAEIGNEDVEIKLSIDRKNRL